MGHLPEIKKGGQNPSANSEMSTCSSRPSNQGRNGSDECANPGVDGVSLLQGSINADIYSDVCQSQGAGQRVHVIYQSRTDDARRNKKSSGFLHGQYFCGQK